MRPGVGGPDVLQQGFVLLSDADTDAPRAPAIATVSTLDQQWDSGAWGLGAAAVQQGALWVDRIYFTGKPEVAWFVERANRSTDAGAFVQVGNEQNLALEGWVGGPDAWFAFEEAVLAAVERPDRMLAMPPSPGVPGWEQWVSMRGPHALHAYGSFDQMRQVVAWYLEQTEDDLYVTECNFGAGNTVDVDAWAEQDLRPFLDWCAGEPRVRFASYFAWRWNESSTLPTSLDAVGTQVETLIRDWVPPAVDPPEEATLDGIDVSNHQGGAIDWAAVKASGRSFAFIKASEDPAFVDAYFARNWAASTRAGLVRGAYHVARPSESSPADSVSLLEGQLENVGGLQAGNLVALDIEDDRVPEGQNLLQWVSEWLALAETVFGVTPVIYSGAWYLGAHGLLDPALTRYPLWWAAYQDEPPPPASYAPWPRLSFWQFTSSGTVLGVVGDCDENRFFGDAAALAALGLAGEPVPAPEPPPFDVDAVWDDLWATADTLEANGWPWLGQGIKALVATSKGEQ